MLLLRRALSTCATALLLAAAAPPVAQAVSPVVRLSGAAALTRTSGGAVTPARFHVVTTFSTDTPGAPLFTVQRAVIMFPDHAGTNGSRFPSCGARQIARVHGDLGRCPKGSRIGSGTVTAQALQLGVTATGQVAIFNSAHGRDVTFNFRTVTPAVIDESIDAPITQLHGGRYGEELTIVVPHSLQEIIAGVFVGVQRLDVTLTGAIRSHGATLSYLKARACPTTPLHGIFDFEDWTSGQTATATVDTRVRCTVR